MVALNPEAVELFHGKSRGVTRRDSFKVIQYIDINVRGNVIVFVC